MVGRLSGSLFGRPLHLIADGDRVTVHFGWITTAWWFWRRVVPRLPLWLSKPQLGGVRLYFQVAGLPAFRVPFVSLPG
ncbi:MAG TPA: hypothetical protein DCY79_07755 [Planctomycetaceae bacterium]|nr:hypothetical protein [Planctomycetaceae bacterium]